jgi:hypothetical protein
MQFIICIVWVMLHFCVCHMNVHSRFMRCFAVLGYMSMASTVVAHWFARRMLMMVVLTITNHLSSCVFLPRWWGWPLVWLLCTHHLLAITTWS